MRDVQIGDAALKPFDHMYSVDQAQYGFTALPKSGHVWIEGKSSHGDYDAMLHFGGNPSRTIAFRWDGKAYQWFGEQEVFVGPRTYKTPDGNYHEQVVITYSTGRSFGTMKGLHIQYIGPKPMRAQAPGTNWSSTLAEVNPLLKRWGLKE